MWEMRCKSSPFHLSHCLARSGQPTIDNLRRVVRPFIPSGNDFMPGQLLIINCSREVSWHMDWGRQVSFGNSIIRILLRAVPMESFLEEFPREKNKS
jgi:hypothetical protein